MRIHFLAGAILNLLTCLAAAANEWAVTCGDDVYCIARVDLVEAKGGSARFKIERSNVADGKVYVTFGPSETLAVDMLVRIETLGTGFSHEGPVEKVYSRNEMTFSETARGPIVEALRGATLAQITVRFGGTIGTVIQDVPLSGLTEALLEIDTKQGRIGQTDALVAWGSKKPASSAVVEQTVAPQVEAQPQTTTTPEIAKSEAPATTDTDSESAPVGSGDIIYDAKDLPPEIADFASKFGCDLKETLPAWGANALGMGGGSVMYSVPCQNGDVNIESYVARKDEGSVPAKLYQFENIPGSEPVWRDTIINPGFDPSTKLLRAIAYDSPNSDCGRFELHRYLAAEDAFELIAVRIKPDCDGAMTPPEEWPVEWTIEEMGG